MIPIGNWFRSEYFSYERPYYLRSGCRNKYGKKVAMDGHRVLPSGAIVVGLWQDKEEKGESVNG